jgi:hypothetical protein
MSIRRYLRQQIRRKYGVRISRDEFNYILLGLVVLLILFWWLVVPALQTLWILVRVPRLFEEVDIGPDNFVPLTSTPPRVPAIIHSMTPDNT